VYKISSSKPEAAVKLLNIFRQKKKRIKKKKRAVRHIKGQILPGFLTITSTLLFQ